MHVARGGGASWREEVNMGRNVPDQDLYLLPSFTSVFLQALIAVG